MDPLGLTISCVPVRVGESEVLLKFCLGGGQPGGYYGGFDVSWRGAVPARLAYLPWSPKNMLSTACRICDDLLQKHRLARAQGLSDF